MKCPFLAEKNKLPPCLAIKNYKWGYLKDFLNNKPKAEQSSSVIHKIKCLKFDNKQKRIFIDENKCINCLFCLLNCPENLIYISKDFTLKEKCDEFNRETDIEIESDYLESFFKGGLITQPKHKLLQKFTEKDETENISIWGASFLNFLACDKNPRLGLEIKMMIKTRDRGGRLDICLLSNDFLFAIETKVSFRKMMQENRYVSQMIAYKEEIENNLKALSLKNIKNLEMLLIDGVESDLLFSGHKNCTSKTGGQSDIFYKNLADKRLFFVSATALWVLAVKKLFENNRKYCLENVFGRIMKSNTYGLTSAGVIEKSKNGFKITPLDDFL